MKTINVTPVEIIGNCRANLRLGDQFQITGMNLKNPQQSNLCFLALGHFPPIIAQLQKGKRFFAHLSCPDCLSRLDQENGVVFLLGHADKWALCQAHSAYSRLCGACDEPEVARQLKAEACRCQKQGDYTLATQKMTAALEALKQASPL